MKTVLISCVLILIVCVASPSQADVFGSQMFTGKFSAEQFSGFNPNYQIAIGDKITLRLWGAFVFEGSLIVDPQGNIFIPNVGPVTILGVRNAELNALVEAHVQKVYRKNVGVYATLEAAQPVKVFVTGFVKNPGLFGGLSSDSVLYYLDKAGGIDPDRGSFVDIAVMRNGQVRKKVDLYDFLLYGKMELMQMTDGDTIVVGPRKHTVSISGEVHNPYQFEFTASQLSVREALLLARPLPGSTHINIVRKQGMAKTSEHYALDKIDGVLLYDGDEAILLTDRFPGTILIRVEGAHSGEHTLILPYGATMEDVFSRIVTNSRSNLNAVQLFRKAVAVRQKELLLASLQALQTLTLTTTSATNEESALREREAELVRKFVEIAKNVEPKGQVVLGSKEIAMNTLIENGDIIRIPENSSIVMVSGEVLFPNAVSFRQKATAEDYIAFAGGFTQKANKAKILILHPSGIMEENAPTEISAGDEIMVLPRVETKRVEITRAITQIIYNIAIAASVVIGL